jgi:RNA polymerase sigma-70 factor, ECF subfamily
MDTPDHTYLFEPHRRMLFGIAYRMLGSAMDAEDMVQEAYVRFAAVPVATVQAPKAFLAKIVTRLCLDRLKSAQAQREQYVGEWLPEPILTDAADALDQMIAAETLHIGFLLMLQRLNDVERAAFVLREVFEYEYDEIAQVLDKSAAACRQVVHRAKARLADATRPTLPPLAEQQQVLAQFSMAYASGDISALLAVLAPTVVVTADGGGKVAAALRPIVGADAVARFFVGLLKRTDTLGLRLRFEVCALNGVLGYVIYDEGNGGRVYQAVLPQIEGGQIVALRLVVNPDKLAHIGRARR